MKDVDIKSIVPPNVGWLEYKLNTQEMDYVWRCIKNKKENTNTTLAGNVFASYKLMDRGDWFYINVIVPLLDRYQKDFDDMGSSLPLKTRHPYHMGKWWVNYHKQNEFNPIHNHNAVYSFVIWMKIPYDSRKQNQKDMARRSSGLQKYNPIGQFQFVYRDMLGESDHYVYEQSPKMEGTMLFFPAQLEHTVYPFYNCDEDRISVAGNIMPDTSKSI